ncbi:MAG: hypothetical protein HC927_08065 [Deltaproteobacteria bacterium]|nr:hypothetical protein [Deltaproteobacteria bacterium]
MPTSHFASSHSTIHAEIAPLPGNARMLLIHSPADSTAIELLHRRFIDMNVQVSCTALSPRCNLQHITTCSYMRTVNKVVFVLSRGFFRDIPQWSNLFAQALELAAAGRLQIAAVLAEVLELPAPLEALAGRLPGNFEFGVPGRTSGPDRP